FDEDAAALMMEAIATAAGDDQVTDRAQAARDAVKQHSKGGQTRGFPKLVETFGEKVASKVAEWLGRQQPAHEPPPAEPPSFVDPYADFVGPPFPLDVLPPTMVEFVKTEHRSMGADASGLAMAALAGVAGATHAETRVRAGEGWSERPILWVCLIGISS